MKQNVMTTLANIVPGVGVGVIRKPRSRFTKKGPGRDKDVHGGNAPHPNYDPAVHEASSRFMPIPGGWR